MTALDVTPEPHSLRAVEECLVVITAALDQLPAGELTSTDPESLREAPLDMRHESRRHNKAHRVALSGVHDTCATEGCERPFAWCEIHHPEWWSEGGKTDLGNGIPLCGWHHHRAHDGRYTLEWLVSGEIRFKRRQRARQAA